MHPVAHVGEHLDAFTDRDRGLVGVVGGEGKLGRAPPARGGGEKGATEIGASSGLLAEEVI